MTAGKTREDPLVVLHRRGQMVLILVRPKFLWLCVRLALNLPTPRATLGMLRLSNVRNPPTRV